MHLFFEFVLDVAEKFTIEFHHGGKFNYHPVKTYVGGKVTFFDHCFSNEMSLVDINEMIETFGHGQIVSCHYKVPGMGLDDGLRMLYTNNDVEEMIKLIPPLKVIEIYLEHDEVNVIECDDYNEEIESTDSEDGDYVCSLGSEDADSEFEYDDDDSEFFDSDYQTDEDDVVFEQNRNLGIGGLGIGGRPGDVEVDLESDGDGSDLGSCNGSSDEEGNKRVRYTEFNASTDMKDPQFEIGMLFRDAVEFRAAVKEYAIKNGKNIRFVKNEKSRVRAKCKVGCPWMIFASHMSTEKTLQVKSFVDEHNCGREWINKNVTST